jgi:hypothetical protein
MMLLNFFRIRRKKNSVLYCPRCSKEMAICITKKDVMDEYQEILRTYRCGRCDLEYDSLELIAPKSEIPSLVGSLSQLCTTVSEFGAALKVLNAVTVKFNKDVVQKINGKQSMN